MFSRYGTRNAFASQLMFGRSFNRIQQMARNSKIYAVRRGHKPGIYTSWDECQKQTKGYGGAMFKSFKTREEADKYLLGLGDSAKASASPAKTDQDKPPFEGPWWTLHYDGASRANPGLAGSGAILKSPDGKDTHTVRRYLGESETNNVAEYYGVISGMKKALEVGAKNIQVYGDSQLITRQLLGEYQVKKDTLKPLHKEAQALMKRFDNIEFHHVLRHLNKEADALANEAIDYKVDDEKA